MGNDFSANINTYVMLFPKGKLPSGKPARVNEKTLIDCFRWFFETYDYTWDQVYAATRKYLNEYEIKENNCIQKTRQINRLETAF